MKLRQPWMLRLIAFIANLIIRWLMANVRIRNHFEDGRNHWCDPDPQRYIYAFWHDTLLSLLRVRKKMNVLVSEHADGEIISRVCNHMGFWTIRGSTNKSGGRAVLELRRAAKRGNIGITPDGPRGPRHKVQAGVVLIASITKLPIVPIGIGFSNAWRARSWDRMAVPRPRSVVTFVWGDPIVIKEKVNRTNRERYRQLIEDELHRVTEIAQQWADAGTWKPAVNRKSNKREATSRSA